MAMSVRKTFTTDVGQMQWRRHHMTAGGVVETWFNNVAVLTAFPSW